MESRGARVQMLHRSCALDLRTPQERDAQWRAQSGSGRCASLSASPGARQGPARRRCTGRSEHAAVPVLRRCLRDAQRAVTERAVCCSDSHAESQRAAVTRTLSHSVLRAASCDSHAQSQQHDVDFRLG